VILYYFNYELLILKQTVCFELVSDCVIPVLI